MQAAGQRQARKVNYYVPVEALAQLLRKVESGAATAEEREYATRMLSMFRSRYAAGNLSKKTALQLGLIDAKGNAIR
jgi:hypothetical protein